MSFYLYQSISSHGGEIEYQFLLEGPEGLDINAVVQQFYSSIDPGPYPALGYDHPQTAAWRERKRTMEEEFAKRHGVVDAYSMDLRLHYLKVNFGLIQRKFTAC